MGLVKTVKCLLPLKQALLFAPLPAEWRSNFHYESFYHALTKPALLNLKLVCLTTHMFYHSGAETHFRESSSNRIGCRVVVPGTGVVTTTLNGARPRCQVTAWLVWNPDWPPPRTLPLRPHKSNETLNYMTPDGEIPGPPTDSSGGIQACVVSHISLSFSLRVVLLTQTTSLIS